MMVGSEGDQRTERRHDAVVLMDEKSAIGPNYPDQTRSVSGRTMLIPQPFHAAIVGFLGGFLNLRLLAFGKKNI